MEQFKKKSKESRGENIPRVRMVSPTQMSAAGVSLEVNTDTVQLSPEQFMVQRDPKRDVRAYIRADVLSW